MNLTAALPTFFVTLREGFEAALVVGIVTACLRQANRQALYPWVLGGTIAGLLASIAVGGALLGGIAALDHSTRPYAPVFKEFLEGGLGIIAIALLGWMLVWMTAQAKSLKSEVQASVGSALAATDTTAAAGWGVFGLVTVSVLREGFETAIFVAAQFQRGWWPAAGAAVGIGGATILGFALFRWGANIDVRRFFAVMGALLLLVVAGLVVAALQHLDRGLGLWGQLDAAIAPVCLTAPDSCILGPQVWDWSTRLSDRAFPGIILKSLVGYRDQLFTVQAIGYLSFLIGVGALYFRALRAPRSPQRPGPATPEAPTADTP